jgi:hypothetical protein
MRYIVTVAALILSYGTTAGYAQKTFVYAPGTHSCEQYLAAVNGHPPGIGKEITHPQDGRFSDDHSVYMAWLHGFLSATNVWVTDEPNSIQSDGAAIDVWIRKWCEQNPTKTLAEAAWAFAWDQRKEYLEAWSARQAR